MTGLSMRELWSAGVWRGRELFHRTWEPPRLRVARLLNHGRPLTREPLVTVVIPTYNRVELLRRCLASVLTQTHTNLEVIVCDHSSTDATPGHVIIDYPGDSRLRYIRVPRRPHYPPIAKNHWLAGPVDPINAGLMWAKGDLIARIDDDDVWLPGHLTKSIWWLRLHNAEFCSSLVEVLDTKGNVQKVIPPYVAPDGTNLGSVQTWVYRSYLRFMRSDRHCWRRPWDAVNDIHLQKRMWRAGVRMVHMDWVGAQISPRPGEDRIGLDAYLSDQARYVREYAFRSK